MDTIDKLLIENGLTQTFNVNSTTSIEHLISPRHRCGIYVLHFPNNMYYVGQSKDVTNRYVQHRRNYKKIDKISFKRVKQEKILLDEEEIRMIRLLEGKGVPLLNIVHTSVTYTSSDFDIILPPEQQKRWVSELSWEDIQGERVDKPELRQKYTDRYNGSFTRMPYTKDATRVLASYIRGAVPAVKQGEGEYWACSCLPKSKVFYRVNINWQEVLTAWIDEDLLYFSFHLALSPLDYQSSLKTLFSQYPSLILSAEETWEDGESIGGLITDIIRSSDSEISPQHTKDLHKMLSMLFDKYPYMVIQNHQYEPGGQDQVRCIVEGVENAISLLEDPPFRQGMRLCNLELMKKGRCNWAKNHCFDLADNIFK